MANLFNRDRRRVKCSGASFEPQARLQPLFSKMIGLLLLNCDASTCILIARRRKEQGEKNFEATVDGRSASPEMRIGRD